MIVGQILLEVESVEALLAKLEYSVSPQGTSEFLAGSVTQYLQAEAANRFANEGDATVGHWAPLLESTQYFRATKHFPPSHPINVRTGQLKNYVVNSQSAVVATGDGASMQYPGGGRDTLLEEKLRTAQFGKDNPSTVARPVLGVGSNDVEQVLMLLMEHIVAGA